MNRNVICVSFLALSFVYSCADSNTSPPSSSEDLLPGANVEAADPEAGDWQGEEDVDNVMPPLSSSEDALSGDAAAGDWVGEDDAGTDEGPGDGMVDPECEQGGETAELEPNETMGAATRVSSGETISGAITGQDEQDWFYISVCGEGILQVELTNAPAVSSEVDLQFDVFASDGDTDLGGAYISNGSEETTFLERNHYVGQAGHYYVRITDTWGNDVDPDAPYQLTITALDVPDAEAEPNGNSKNPNLIQAIATPIESGAPVTGYIASEEDTDWFAIEAEGESILHIELTNAPAISSPVDLTFEVFMPNAETALGEETLFDGSEETAELFRNYYIGEAGTWFIRVADSWNNDCDYDQPFTLTATLLPVPDAEAEPNGNSKNPNLIQAIATPTESGAPVTGYIASDDDTDWYVVQVGETGVLSVTLSNGPAVSSAVDFEMKIYLADAETEIGMEHDFDGGDGTTVLDLSVNVEPGPYYIVVRDSWQNDCDYDQPYQITATHP